MSMMYIRDKEFVKKSARSVNANIDNDACLLVASEVEMVLRLVIQVC